MLNPVPNCEPVNVKPPPVAASARDMAPCPFHPLKCPLGKRDDPVRFAKMLPCSVCRVKIHMECGYLISPNALGVAQNASTTSILCTSCHVKYAKRSFAKEVKISRMFGLTVPHVLQNPVETALPPVAYTNCLKRRKRHASDVSNGDGDASISSSSDDVPESTENVALSNLFASCSSARGSLSNSIQYFRSQPLFYNSKLNYFRPIVDLSCDEVLQTSPVKQQTTSITSGDEPCTSKSADEAPWTSVPRSITNISPNVLSQLPETTLNELAACLLPTKNPRLRIPVEDGVCKEVLKHNRTLNDETTGRRFREGTVKHMLKMKDGVRLDAPLRLKLNASDLKQIEESSDPSSASIQAIVDAIYKQHFVDFPDNEAGSGSEQHGDETFEYQMTPEELKSFNNSRAARGPRGRYRTSNDDISIASLDESQKQGLIYGLQYGKRKRVSDILRDVSSRPSSLKTGIELDPNGEVEHIEHSYSKRFKPYFASHVRNLISKVENSYATSSALLDHKSDSSSDVGTSFDQLSSPMKLFLSNNRESMKNLNFLKPKLR